MRIGVVCAVVFACVLFPAVSAAPSLTITSPANGSSHSTQGISFSVTSDETADFFIERANGRRVYLDSGVTSYATTLWQKAGDFSFTIHANSSSGTASKTVWYSSTVSNPISITSCGATLSSNTAYVVANNISGTSCLTIEDLVNVTVDLQGYTVSGLNALTITNTEQVFLHNGHVSSGGIPMRLTQVSDMILEDLLVTSSSIAWNVEESISGTVRNTVFETDDGMSGMSFSVLSSGGSSVVFDGVTMRLEEIRYEPFNGDEQPLLLDEFRNVTFFLADGETEFPFVCAGYSLCEFVFTDTNTSDVVFEVEEGDHQMTVINKDRLEVHVKDQEGDGVPATVELDTLSPFIHNDDANVLFATDEDGNRTHYVTSSIVIYESGQDQILQQHLNPQYNITCRSGDVVETGNITFASPAEISFTLVFPTATTDVELTSCGALASNTDYFLDGNITADQSPCIDIDGVENVTLDGNGFYFVGNNGTFVAVADAFDIEVFNAKIVSSAEGVVASGSDDVTLRAMEIDSATTGIVYNNTNNSVIQENTVTGSTTGILIASSEGVTLLENVFSGNGENVFIDPSEDIILVKNVMQAADVGLRLLDIINSVFIGDVIVDNNESIVMENANNVDFIRTQLNSTSLDILSTDSNSTFSSVVFDEGKTQQEGTSTIFGFFPPACKLVESNVTVEDEDEDGFNSSVDCDDTDATIFPGAFDFWGDGIDQNCDALSCGIQSDYAYSCSSETFVADDDAELSAYLVDYGLESGQYKKLKINYNVNQTNVEIHSPCKITFAQNIQLTGESVCIDGREGVVDGGNFDVEADLVAFLSEQGDVNTGQGSEISSEQLTIDALKLAQIGASTTSDMGNITILSRGDFSSGQAVIKQSSSIIADRVTIQANREAKIGDGVVLSGNALAMTSNGSATSSDVLISQNSDIHVTSLVMSAYRLAKIGTGVEVVANQVIMDATGPLSGTEVRVNQDAVVDASVMNMTSEKKAFVGTDAVVNVTNNFHMEAESAGDCTIKASAAITAGSESGNCLV